MSALDKFYDFTLNLPDAKLTSKAMSLCNIDRNVFNIYLTLQEGKNNPILNADLGNYTVTMIVVKPKTKEYVEKVGVVDGSNDRLLFELGEMFNDQIGSYKGEIKVQNGNEVITSSSFAYTVTQSLISGLNAEIEASPDVEILRQLINEVKAVVGMTPGDPDSLLTDYQKKNDNTLITTDKTIIGAINENSSQIQETVKMKRSLINDRGIQDSIFSVNNSRIGYEDTQETIFTENWNDISQWKTQTIAGVQVSNNNLFSTGLQGGGSGANHSYKINDNENLRAVFKVNLNTFPKNGGVMIGVSNDEAGTVPKNAGGSVFALYLSGGGNANSMNLGVQGSTAEGLKYTTGEYIITVTVDKKYISIVASKTDNMLEISCRRLREGFNINNLYIFNSDENALSGISIGLCSARKGLQMIKPNSYGENIAKSVQWTGDGTQSFRIYLPKDYDSRKPSPLVICFHGNGTSEINWSTGFGDNNYGRLQRTLTENGYIVLGCSLNSSTTTWGNKLSTNAYYQAYKYVRDNYSIGSVVIFANSMGGIESLNAIAENKIPCVAWAGTVPVFNLKNVYQNSLFTNGIKGAYEISSNGSDYDIKTEGRDPNLMSGYAFRGIPMWVASPDDDDKVSKFENTDKLIEKVKDISIDLRVISVPNGMGGHSFNIQPYLESIIAFFNEYVMS